MWSGSTWRCCYEQCHEPEGEDPQYRQSQEYPGTIPSWHRCPSMFPPAMPLRPMQWSSPSMRSSMTASPSGCGPTISRRFWLKRWRRSCAGRCSTPVPEIFTTHISLQLRKNTTRHSSSRQWLPQPATGGQQIRSLMWTVSLRILRKATP